MDKFHQSNEFLEAARKAAKKSGYNPNQLFLAKNGVHKLTYHSPLGLRHFGRLGYGDFLYYQKFEPQIADMKRRVFRKSHSAISTKYALDKYSPNELAINILW